MNKILKHHNTALQLPQRLATAEAMRRMDQRAIQELGIPGMVLMENAARSVADFMVKSYLQDNPGFNVVVCCGKGNNGGDGFAIARILGNRGYRVKVVLTGSPTTRDAQLNLKLWEHFGATFKFPGEDSRQLLQNADIVVDAIFGTGLERQVEGVYKEWIEAINESNAIKIGVDIPSGVNSDDSKIMGIAVRCDHTISFQVGKQGCFQLPGASYAGNVVIADICIPVFWEEHEEPVYLATLPFAKSLVLKRPEDAHKGSFGHLLTICGSAGMGGAAALSSFSALKNGTGLVSACVPLSLRDRLPGNFPEVMTLSRESSVPQYFTGEDLEFLKEAIVSRDAVCVGCGLGQQASTLQLIRDLVPQIKKPVVLDADGLNALAPLGDFSFETPVILTPHPKEFSRLCEATMAEIRDNRIQLVRQYSKRWNAILVLKGAHSVIGLPNGTVFINPTGNQGMATAGSGDVLTGIIGGLLAQGYEPENAAILGTFLHGLAGDLLLKHMHPACITAMSMLDGINLAWQVLADVS
ncbi:MAG: NAD(P)H-hydrate dehydratase [SAR324 cluster bacterium]|nr:NAD(P)H-hydrate dehydratase [SAR324 cluster bacterium]